MNTPAMTPLVPDNTAVRVALWRALHLEVDAAPPVLVDDLGLKLVAPAEGWQQRPDMSPFTRPFRASILARARYVEDLVKVKVSEGRRPIRHSRGWGPATLEWKRERLMQVGSGIGPNLRFVPVDFERGESWVAQLTSSGFLRTKPAVIASTGVSMYLTHDAIAAMLHEVASLAAGSTFVMSFMLPIELADPDVRPGIEAAAKGARANGTPFISFYRPLEMLELARAAGFREVNHVSAAALAERFSRGGATVCARRTTPRNCWWRRADSAPVFGGCRWARRPRRAVGHQGGERCLVASS